MLSHDNKTYDAYAPGASQHPTTLDAFQIFKKGTACYGYENPYSETQTYEDFVDGDHMTQAFHELVNPAENSYYTNEWKQKYVAEWTTNDIMEWLIDTAQNWNISEFDIPLSRFRECTGAVILNFKLEDWIKLLLPEFVDSTRLRIVADTLCHALQQKIASETSIHDMLRPKDDFIYPKQEIEHFYPTENPISLTDLDRSSEEIRKRIQDGSHIAAQSYPSGHWDSEEDTKERLHDVIMAESTSPESGSDNSKSGDEGEEKRKKRPPGRPPGTGKKLCKRIKNVSVPEFLKELLLNPMYCPSIIKWEEYEIGKFRFVKPNEVARLWGDKKHNSKMSFEKFSRAMRYHYKQGVLTSVPTARLVYQFGPNAPNYRTDNPNFKKSTPSSIIRSNPNYTMNG